MLQPLLSKYDRKEFRGGNKAKLKLKKKLK